MSFFFVISFTSLSLSHGQDGTKTYVSDGYFKSINLADSLMIKGNFVITIAQNQVEITKFDIADTSKDSLYLKRRTMSGMKYRTMDGEEYFVWKLGDRKMVLRQLHGKRYLSLYQSDEYGLPATYITFKIKE